jgi:nicotinate-nucleotide--dimethylbenzimidazole phosphoribosyltransferase
MAGGQLDDRGDRHVSRDTAWASRAAPELPTQVDPSGAVALLLDHDSGRHDPAVLDAAEERLASLATPPGALGDVGALAVRLAGMSGRCPPPVPCRPALLVATGDHGVHAHGVTSWPQGLSAVIAGTIAVGGAGGAVLADEVGARLVVVDAGLVTPAAPDPRLVSASVVRGTRDLRVEDALTDDEVLRCVALGAAVTDALVADGADLLVLGDAGIGNTTASAALIALATGAPPDLVTGRGAGSDDATLARKLQVVGDAVARASSGPARPDGLGWLAAVGGAEHATLMGALLAGVRARVPVLLDGVVTCAAALAAVATVPGAVAGLVAGHRSAEPGATIALRHLGLSPLLDAGMRLGEGSGALLALPIVQAAARLLGDVATLAELGADPAV